MDTVVSLLIPGAGRAADPVVEAITDDLARIEERASVFRPDSEINRWSQGRLAEDDLSPETRQILAGCAELAERSSGVFSPWREGRYDPTGYTKGWAMAQVARRLDDAGFGSYCLNAGGDIVARGRGPTGRPWRIGIAHPFRAGELALVLTPVPDDPAPFAVATSGTTERGRHIAHPVTGWRPTHSMVTVVGVGIAEVDAIATAALAAGEHGHVEPARLIRALGLEGFGFDEERRPWWTDGMTAYAPLPRL